MSSTSKDLLREFTGIIVFNISNKEFCVNEKHLVTILNPQKLESEPNNPNVNDEIRIGDILVRLFDIHSYFGISKPLHTENTRILVVLVDEMKIGFFVDMVKELITVDDKIIGEKLKFAPIKHSHLLGKILYEDRKIYLPNLNGIVTQAIVYGNKININSI